MAALRERLLLEEEDGELDLGIEAEPEASKAGGPETEASGPEPGATETEAPADPDRANALSGVVNSQIASVYADIDGLNGIIAMLRDEPDVPSRDEVIGLLDSIVDDRSVHVGMLQAISGMLSGRGGLVDAGSGIAAGEIAPAEAEGEE